MPKCELKGQSKPVVYSEPLIIAVLQNPLSESKIATQTPSPLILGFVLSQKIALRR